MQACELCAVFDVDDVEQPIRSLKQFLAHLDTSRPFDPYVVVSFISLPRIMRYAHNDENDIPHVEEYLLLNANEPHLSFDELIRPLLDPNHELEHQVRPF